MSLALDPRQHLGDVIETADEARAQPEPGGPKRPRRRSWLIEDGQPGAQGLVDNSLE